MTTEPNNLRPEEYEAWLADLERTTPGWKTCPDPTPRWRVEATAFGRFTALLLGWLVLLGAGCTGLYLAAYMLATGNDGGLVILGIILVGALLVITQKS